MLRPARPLPGVLTSSGELRVTRRAALRMLALAGLLADRTLVAFPLRDERGLPCDLVLALDTLRFPAARWSDVRSRLGAGRIALCAEGAPAAESAGKPRRPESAGRALLVSVDAQWSDLTRLRRGELDLGHLRVILTG
ncbi:hypothetical protein [Dactylosporangium matsuzakiense]|uniref:Uncharacterized protein n=1 Tax=Dactylosporangium matsuzakiense TaxID=53360 RepID=A0A9W6KMU3_9ACTN|nr:hypothetical protein [Dactylosporangium matsuzakiense]UWZ41984.1 hypothetical protein Dmats_30770 [Dactylosporangium matsuzakiense]GLL04937.1 hypothetical protein GCM10017581_066840 [Dactylosporangium matsuzakiense]